MRQLFLASLFLTALPALPALAHFSDVHLCRPYAIVMTCDADMPSCGRPHMAYAPGQSLAGNPTGKYFYMTPRQRHHHQHWKAERSRHHHMMAMGCEHIHVWWD